MTGTKQRFKYGRKRKGVLLLEFKTKPKQQEKHPQKNLNLHSQQRVHHPNNHHRVPNVINRSAHPERK